MSQVNPAGTAFLGLVEALIDLVNNHDISRIEVVMGSYDLDAQGQKELLGGTNSVALRSFVVRGMNKDVQEQLRQQIEAGPIAYLMILWTERFAKENKLGVATFDPVTNNRKADVSGLDEVERSAIADYLQRQKPRPCG